MGTDGEAGAGCNEEEDAELDEKVGKRNGRTSEVGRRQDQDSVGGERGGRTGRSAAISQSGLSSFPPKRNRINNDAEMIASVVVSLLHARKVRSLAR